MPGAYSLDLRRRCIEAYERGEGTQEKIAKRFCIGRKTFQEWLVLKRKTGDVIPKEYTHHGQLPIINEEGQAFIKNLIEKTPDILISEIRLKYKKKFKISVSQSMVSRALQSLNLRRKKKSIYAQEQERADVKKNGKIGQRTCKS